MGLAWLQVPLSFVAACLFSLTIPVFIGTTAAGQIAKALRQSPDSTLRTFPGIACFHDFPGDPRAAGDPDRRRSQYEPGTLWRLIIDRLKPRLYYQPKDISPYFWVNGKIPQSAEWRELAAQNFSSYRLSIGGEPLSVELGAPLRLRVENQLGYKMVKWIRSIEFVESIDDLGKGFGGKNEDEEYYDLLADS